MNLLRRMFTNETTRTVTCYRPMGKMERTFGRKGRGRGQFNMPCGVAVTYHGDIVVADTENNRIQVFLPDGRPKLQVGEKGHRPHQLNHPMCVALTPPLTTDTHDQHICVTDSVNACVKVFRLDGSFVAQYSDCAMFDFPYGIVVSHDQHIIVTDLCKHSVIVLYPSGCKRIEFGGLGDNNNNLDHPYFVAVDKINNIIVSDSGNSAIKIFTFDGKLLHKYGLDDFRLLDEHFVLLQGIVIDSAGNVVVVGNSTVYICARNGRLWEVILPQDGLHSPKGIAYSPLGQLIITQCGLDSQHEVSVFSYNTSDYSALQTTPLSIPTTNTVAKRKARKQRPSSSTSADSDAMSPEI